MPNLSSVPIGVGTSFPNLIPNQATPQFTPILNTSDQGGDASSIFVISFSPIDVNNPGVLTLYDSGGNSIISLNTEGYETVQPTPGTAYYFNSTRGAKQVSCISPSVWR